jgi:dipeptidyl aminopeptidase/acylaminoacyl peptidase
MPGLPRLKERADHRPLSIAQVTGISLPIGHDQPYVAGSPPASRPAQTPCHRATTNYGNLTNHPLRPRGCGGWAEYQQLIHHDFGGDDLKDFEAAARYLRTLDGVDPQRIGVFGGSYGGFATLSCLSRLPAYWACGVSLFGPSNLVTLARTAPPTWQSMMAGWLGDPDTEADFLLSRSPSTYADDIRAPLFVIQGANDPRVVKDESDQIVDKLRGRGVDVRYDVYPDEGHGFTKTHNETKAMRDTADFLVAHLGRPRA